MEWTDTTLAGRYRLEALLGRGSTGQVWRAVDLELHRPVAVKLLHVELLGGSKQDRHSLGRFEREGRATARLTHRNIAAVYDVGRHLDMPYLVFELLRGHDLRTVLTRDFPDGMPLERVLEYGAQIAEALAVAHAVGIVHRDIKPANLMLMPDETVKVCDFGIARLQSSSEPQLTHTGMVIGTPAYMPPEQFEGGPVDPAADMYALGATLFHLMTGRLPFTARDFLELRLTHSTVPAPRVGSLRADTSFALEALIDALLAKKPHLRPVAADTAARLREPVAAVPRPGGDRFTNLEAALEAADRIEAGGSRARTLAVIAGTLTERDPSRARTVLATAEEALTGDRYFDSGAAGAIARIWARYDPRHAAGLLNEAERRLRERANAHRRVEGESHDLASPTAWELQDLAQAWATTNPDTAVELVRGISHADHRAHTACAIALKVAKTQPDTAERLAGLLAGSRHVDLARIAVVLAATDLDAAQRVADRIDPPYGPPFTEMAEALARRNPSAAERFAAAVSDPQERARALTAVACHIATHDAVDAERIVAIIDSDQRARARDAVALAVLTADPHAAARLLSSADFERYDTPVQLRICRVLATVATDLVERIARRMSGSFDRAEALLTIGTIVARDDPVRGAGLVEDAVRQASACARSISSAGGLARFAAALASYDRRQAAVLFKEAERLARARKVRDAFVDRGTALLEVAEELTAFDAGAAERLVRKAGKKAEGWRVERVVVAVAKVDPVAAVRIARTQRPSYRCAAALVNAVRAIAAVDPAAARHLAEQIDEHRHQEQAWTAIAQHLAVVDPGAAVRFVTDLAEQLDAAEPDGWGRRRMPVELVEVVARKDPAAAQRLIGTLEHHNQDQAWSAIATAWAGAGSRDASDGY